MQRFKSKTSSTSITNNKLKQSAISNKISNLNSKTRFKEDEQISDNQREVSNSENSNSASSQSKSQSNSNSNSSQSGSENSESEGKSKKPKLKKFNYKIENFDVSFDNVHLAYAIKASENKMSIQTDPEKMPEENSESLCVQVYYHPTIKTIGWDKLFVKTTGKCNLDAEFQVAGLLEGKFSHKMVKAMFEGMKKMMEMPKDISEKIYKRINDHYSFIRSNLENIQTKTDFDKVQWTHIQLAMAQLEGILDGQNLMVDEKEKMTMLELLFINADGEIMELANAMNENRYFRFKDLEKLRLKHKKLNKFLKLSRLWEKGIRNALNPKKAPNIPFRFKEEEYVSLNLPLMKKQDPELQFYFKETESHCTAVMKLMHDRSNNITDLQIGHSTWDDQNEMIRIQKEYDFNIKGKQLKVHFSSYGGTIQSTDDQQVLNSGMVIVETTMEIVNTLLYKKIKQADQSLPNFIRIYVSNLLAENPQDWVDIFKKNTSDTQSSQWLIADMNKVDGAIGKEKLEVNSVIVQEQIVDKNGTQDVSELLNQHTQFAGQNRPFFLSDQAGYKNMEDKYKNVDLLHLYSNQANPRAVQIRFLQKYIFNMNDFQHLMRQNNANKRLMRGEKWFSNQQQISPRQDLLEDLNREFGATDSKVTNVSLALKMGSQAISGPSFDNSPPYIGSNNLDVLPKLWNFSWVVMNEMNLKRQFSEYP